LIRTIIELIWRALRVRIDAPIWLAASDNKGTSTPVPVSGRWRIAHPFAKNAKEWGTRGFGAETCSHKEKGPESSGPQCLGVKCLNIVIQRKLIRMRPQSHRVHFLRALVIDIGAEQFLGEDVALEQKPMVLFQCTQRVFE